MCNDRYDMISTMCNCLELRRWECWPDARSTMTCSLRAHDDEHDLRVCQRNCLEFALALPHTHCILSFTWGYMYVCIITKTYDIQHSNRDCVCSQIVHGALHGPIFVTNTVGMLILISRLDKDSKKSTKSWCNVVEAHHPLMMQEQRDFFCLIFSSKF